MSRLLIIACSQKKSSTESRVPAIERYDGPAFGVLRRYLRHYPADDLAVWILSAKLGLVPYDTLIFNYDQRMTRERALILRPEASGALRRVFAEAEVTEVGLCLGKTYRLAVDEALIPSHLSVHLLTGGLGKRLTALKTWLHRDCQVTGEMLLTDGGQRAGTR